MPEKKSIKFSLSAGWQSEIAQSQLEYVDEFYGSYGPIVPQGCFMPGQTASSKGQFVADIEDIRKKGAKFNYLLDSTCMGNCEMTMGGQKQLRRLLEWMIKYKVYAVSVSIPYLLEFIKCNYPELKVYASAYAGIDSLERAKYWDNLGADKITLSAVSAVNRDFKLLHKIRENTSCRLEIIANLSCLNDCPFWMYQIASSSHLLPPFYEKGSKFFQDYCATKCDSIKARDPVEFIRSGWVRPEDLHYYEKMGINSFKLVTGGMSGSERARMLEAYINRRYEGDLCMLFGGLQKPCFIRLDNDKLDGFLDYFAKNNCGLNCGNCDYCGTVFGKTAKIDECQRLDLIKKCERQQDESLGTL